MLVIVVVCSKVVSCATGIYLGRNIYRELPVCGQMVLDRCYGLLQEVMVTVIFEDLVIRVTCCVWDSGSRLCVTCEVLTKMFVTIPGLSHHG